VSKNGLSVYNGGAVIYDHVANRSTLLVRNNNFVVNQNVSVLSVEAIAHDTGVPFPLSFNLIEVIIYDTVTLK
jgi:nicotinamide mononucleotide (NMN) deamidase PncC